jgi:hypothetical protein
LQLSLRSPAFAFRPITFIASIRSLNLPPTLPCVYLLHSLRILPISLLSLSLPPPPSPSPPNPIPLLPLLPSFATY